MSRYVAKSKIAPILTNILIPIMSSYTGGGADFGTVTILGLKVNILELEKAGKRTSALLTFVVIKTILDVHHVCGS